MATTFDVIYLGNPGIEIDVTEGNTTNDQVAALLGSSFGTLQDPLFLYVALQVIHIFYTPSRERQGGCFSFIHLLVYA